MLLLYKFYSSFFIISGTFALLMLLILILLLVKHRDVGKSANFSNLRNFILCFFCIIMIYYWTSFVGIQTGVFERGVFSRIVDSSLFILLLFFWLSFVRTHLHDNGCGRPVFDRIVNWVLGILLVLSDFNCAFLMDSNFYVEGTGRQAFAVAVEVVLCVTYCGFNVIYMIDTIKAEIKKDTRNFIVIISILLFYNGLFNEVITIRLICGSMNYVVESFYYDPTSLIMLCTAVSTLIYLFRHDFSPIYFVEHQELGISDEEVMEQFAREYCLSKREVEIAKFIFDGDSYESVAEKLFISKLTVKKHVHNIYEKLGISGRMELIKLVRERKNHINPK